MLCTLALPGAEKRTRSRTKARRNPMPTKTRIVDWSSVTRASTIDPAVPLPSSARRNAPEYSCESAGWGRAEHRALPVGIGLFGALSRIGGRVARRERFPRRLIDPVTRATAELEMMMVRAIVAQWPDTL